MNSLGNKIVKVNDIKEYIRKLAEGLGKDEGLLFGVPDAKVNKILVCWMADVAAIRYAAQTGANLIVTHESLFYPYDIVVNGGVPEFMTWHTNHKRMELLARHDISVIRAHGSLDKICIFDDFASVLELGEPVICEANYVKIYEVEPVTYGDLIKHVKKKLKLGQLRVTSEAEIRKVKRIGLPWGGLGLFINVGYMQELIKHGCDVFIAGETDNYGLRFAVDAGIGMIETGHEVSENPGLRHFAEMLAEAFFLQFIKLMVKISAGCFIRI